MFEPITTIQSSDSGLDKHPLGFVGLGKMGGSVAERLASIPFELHVYDRDSAATGRLQRLGACVHENAKSVADSAMTVFTCLPTVEASRTVTMGETGLVHGAKVRQWVEMSTVGPSALVQVAAELAARGISTVDAPVSGGAKAAQEGTLSVMLAGPAIDRNIVEAILSKITSRLFVIGDLPGEAQKMKLVNNLLAAANMATSFEALALGSKLGLPPSKIIEVVRASSGQNSGMDAKKVAPILDGSFTGLGAIALLEKDIGLAFQAAREAGFPLEELRSFSGMAQLWREAVDQGLAGEDISRLIQVVERGAGVRVRGAAFLDASADAPR